MSTYHIIHSFSFREEGEGLDWLYDESLRHLPIERRLVIASEKSAQALFSNPNNSVIMLQGLREGGRVLRVRDGIVTIWGLSDLQAGEIVWVCIDKAEWSSTEGFLTPTEIRALVLNLHINA